MPGSSSATATNDPAAFRHVVYFNLLFFLPPASADQTRQFMANLGLPKESLTKFLMLRVSPELAETPFRGMPPARLLEYLEREYGQRILEIPGFYRDGRGRLCWTVPRGSVLFGYRSRLGLINGILCQPLDRLDTYFLLSSKRFGGQKAIRLTTDDNALFQAGLMTKEGK